MNSGTLVLLIPIVGIVSVFGFLTVAVILGSIVKMRRQSSHTLSAEEEKMLRDLWNGLQKMEARITNLETILIQRERQ